MQRQIEQLVGDFERGRISRRHLVSTLTGIAAAMGAGAVLGQQDGHDGGGGQDAAPADQGPTFTATGLDHLALNVTDIARSRDWYIRHLGMKVTRESRSSCFLSCGDDFVALFRSDAPGMHHYSYAIPEYNVEQAVERLRAAGLDPNRQGGRVYFRDPDGLVVQVSRG